MHEFLDLTALPADITRAEREYLDFLSKDAEDGSKRHSCIIECWNEATQKYQPARFIEPDERQLISILSEFAPIFIRTQIKPACSCPERYLQTQQALDAILITSHSFQLTQEAYKELRGKVSRTVHKAMKDLVGQVFFSATDIAEAIVPVLLKVITQEQLQENWEALLSCFPVMGDRDDLREKRRQVLEDRLDEWHGLAPVKPYPPTQDVCPFCHLPYQYSLLELIPFETKALLRMLDLLIGAPVRISSIPNVLEALELWLFSDDFSPFTKKKGLTRQTLTGLFWMRAKQQIGKVREDLIESLLASSESLPFQEDTSPDSASNTSAATPPPPPPATPDAN